MTAKATRKRKPGPEYRRGYRDGQLAMLNVVTFLMHPELVEKMVDAQARSLWETLKAIRDGQEAAAQ